MNNGTQHALRCPDCGATDNKVIDTRPTKAATRRRRVCSCGCRFTTYEIGQYSIEQHTAVVLATRTWFDGGVLHTSQSAHDLFAVLAVILMFYSMGQLPRYDVCYCGKPIEACTGCQRQTIWG